MKSFISILILTLAAAVACPVLATGGVYVNNSRVCSSVTQMGLGSSGDLSITCSNGTSSLPTPVTTPVAPVSPPVTPPAVVTPVAPVSCNSGGRATGVFPSQIVDSTVASISGSGYASYQLPVWTRAGHSVMVNAVNSPNPGVIGLSSQFAISTCPGDFSAPPKCMVVGSPENGAISLSARSAASEGPSCTLVVGQQYYLNVRNLNCPAGATCSEIVQLHGG